LFDIPAYIGGTDENHKRLQSVDQDLDLNHHKYEEGLLITTSCYLVIYMNYFCGLRITAQCSVC
jgi:hypothetical protein